MNRALLIIDVQNDYFPGGRSELHKPVEALANIKHILSMFREKSFPVIHVQHINTRPGALFFLPDTEGVQIHKDLAPLDGENIVIKHAPNSFFETNLDEILKSNDITGLVVCGMMSHMCVDTTVRACKDRSIKVILPYDACAAKALAFDGNIIPAETVHAVFMASLKGMFAEVIRTCDMVL